MRSWVLFIESVCYILTLDFSYNIEIISIMFSKMAY